MKKIIIKRIIASFVIIMLLVTQIRITDVLAFENEVNNIVRTTNGAKPYDYLYGQTYKYDKETATAFFCTAYSKSFYDNLKCTLSSDWTVPLRAGIAKIITLANLSNYSIETANNNSNILNENLQLTLAINALIREKGEGIGNYNLVSGYEPKDLLNNTYKNILSQARDEYTRVATDKDIKVELMTGTKVTYNPMDQQSSNPSFIFHVKNTNTDNFKVKIFNNASSLPEGIKLRVSFYKNYDNNTLSQLQTLSNNDTYLEYSNSLNNVINTDNNIKNLNDIYIKVEMIDERDNKTEGFRLPFAIAANGNFSYDVARNYNCGGNNQTVVPNKTEPQSDKYSDSKVVLIKTQNVPDAPNIKIVKVDQDNNNNKLENAYVKIIYGDIDSDDNNISTTKKTNSDGIIEIDDVSDGKYCIKEIKAPSGYLLKNELHCFTVLRDTTDNNNIVVNKVDENDSKINYSSNENLITVTLENKKNKILINKINVNGIPVVGAHLKITQSSDVNSSLQALYEWDTTEQPKEITNLPIGTYYVHETSSPDKYVLNKIPVVIKITGKETQEEINVNFINFKTNLKIRKVDENSQKLSGATLQIKDTNGNVVVEPFQTTNRDKVITGILSIEKEYILEEVNAPDGYSKAEPIKFKLNDEGEVIIIEGEKTTDVISLTLTNIPNEIAISKTDINGDKKLENAHLQLLDNNNNIIKLKDDGNNGLIPDENGAEYWVTTTEAQIIRKLPVGKYKLKEIKAPNGYVLTDQILEFSIDSKGNLIIDQKTQKSNTLLMSNQETKVYISKQDITTKQELPGAELILKDENGSEIDKWTSTNEPHLIEGLGEGTYTLTEITSPDGYSINEEAITFTIDENGVISGDTIMYNSPIPDVPQTLSNQSILFMIIGILLVGTGVGLYIYGIKKKNKI